MFCNQCGTQNPEAGNFCTRCGHPLTPPVTALAGFQVEANVGPVPAIAGNASERPTDTKAVASLVLGILSLTVFWIVAGIPAVILGHMSRGSIRRSLGRLKGEGMALAGLIMGYISLAGLPFILIIAAIAIPNLLRSRIAANEASAVSSVRQVIKASIEYRNLHPNIGYPVSLEELAASGRAGTPLIDSGLADGQKSGYRFEYESQAMAEGPRETFFVRAIPMNPGSTGNREFCADESGMVRFAAQGSPCSAESETLE